MKGYCKIFLLTLVFGLLCHINVLADVGNEKEISAAAVVSVKKWVFSDKEFDDLGDTLTEDVSFAELELHKGIGFRTLSKNINNKNYTRCMDITETVTTDKSYVSLYLDGPSNVYFIAQTNQADHPKNLMIKNNNSMQTSYISINEAKGYCYEYRDKGGTIEIRSEKDKIRVYAIMVEPYDSTKYDYLNSSPERLWDLSQITEDEVLNENRNFDGLTVFKGVNLIINEHTNKYGLRYYRAIDLETEGTDENNSIAFDVQKDTDIYITARSTSSEIRKLKITDRYGCDIETDNNIQTFDVTNNADTYKLTYRGEDNTLYAYSESGAIRIYQVAAVKRRDMTADDIYCNFSDCSNIAVGQNMNGMSINGINFENGTAVKSTDLEYTKAVQINGKPFPYADKLYFNISNPAGSNLQKTFRIYAKGDGKTNQKLVVANKYGYVIGAFDLEGVTKEYSIEYSGSYDMLYLYATLGSAEIYKIEFIKNAEPAAYSLNVIKGSNYRYSFTAENASSNTTYKYIIEYDPSKLKVVHIGKDNDFTGGLTDKSIENVVDTSGKITFDLAGDTVYNWSGIATSVLFEGIADGNTTIKFSAEGR